MFNWRTIARFVGFLMLLSGIMMSLSIPFSLYHNTEEYKGILIASLISICLGSGFYFWGKQKEPLLKKRDGFLIVTLGWVAMTVVGALPYIFTGEITNITDAYFESVSGFSTTGASILTDIEAMPKSLLFWRSMTHWIGGMGIIVLTIAILPLLGVGGFQLFAAEAPGPTADKMHPRITETAKALWATYLILTAVEAILLWIGGMTPFDSVNHAMATMATGGFSTKNASIAYYDSAFIQYVITIFMFLAGTNFTLTYFALRGNFKKALKSEEFRIYASVIGIITVVVTTAIIITQGTTGELAFRQAIFQVVSIITTTGFVSADYTVWSPFITMIFFLLFFVGGSAGSTSGGVKIVRHALIFKNSVLEMKRLIHPRAIIPVRFNGKAVSQEIVSKVLSFFLLYVILWGTSAAIMALILSISGGYDLLNLFETSVGAVIACLGNIGPAIGEVGPVDNFSHLPNLAKWFLSFLMLVGRLEVFTVLVLFSPFFWRES